MARKLRVEYKGAIYHLMNRGDRREPIILDEEDSELFIKTLGEACAKTHWLVHAFCLMPNHFHLVVETPDANLVSGMKWFLGTYTSRFNRKNRLFGHLFSGRYKSLIVDGSGNQYLRTVCAYVHLNPARAKLIADKSRLKCYPWSSFPLLIQPPSKRPTWLRHERVFGDLGIQRDTTRTRRQFEQRMEVARGDAEPEGYRAIRRGWCLGNRDFRKELLDEMAEKTTVHHYGKEKRLRLEAQTEKIVRTALDRLGWSEEDLERRRKGDPDKATIARQLKAETTMTAAWIARQLRMGSESNVRRLVAMNEQNAKSRD